MKSSAVEMGAFVIDFGSGIASDIGRVVVDEGVVEVFVASWEDTAGASLPAGFDDSVDFAGSGGELCAKQVGTADNTIVVEQQIANRKLRWQFDSSERANWCVMNNFVGFIMARSLKCLRESVLQ